MRAASIQALIHNIVHHLFHGTAVIESTEPLTGGVSARAVTRIRLQDEQQKDLVLRIHGELQSDRLPVALEFQLLQSLYDFGLPVPKPLLYGPTGRHEEDTFLASSTDPFLVMEMANGSSDIPPGQESRCITLMAATLGKIHNVPSSGFQSEMLPQRSNPLPELWLYYNEDSFPKSALALRRLLNENDTSYDGIPCLLHGDYWPGNLLFREDDEDPVVIDWEDAAVGDFWSDVATCRVEVRYKWGRSAMEVFTQSYCAHRSVILDEPRLWLWQVYVASAAVANMGSWGLDPALEARMRAEATASVEEASQRLLQIRGEEASH